MLRKLIALAFSGVASLGLTALTNSAAGPQEPPPPPKAKAKGGPVGELRKAYDLLRRIRADGRVAGKPEPRLLDWTDRATVFYRDGLKAEKDGDPRSAGEYGLAAHDLARAVDHARNASLAEKPDDDLPPPPDGPGPAEGDEAARRDLRKAHDRIVDVAEDSRGKDAKFFLDAARDLYNASRRDAEAGRFDRAGELARAAEAITHVPEHLALASGDDRPEPKEKAKRKPGRPDPKKEKEDDRPDPKGKRDRDEPKAKPGRPDPKAERDRDALPPPL